MLPADIRDLLRPRERREGPHSLSEVQLRRLSPCTNTGAGAANTCTGTALWNTPVGAQIGQTFTDVAIRSQFAF